MHAEYTVSLIQAKTNIYTIVKIVWNIIPLIRFVTFRETSSICLLIYGQLSENNLLADHRLDFRKSDKIIYIR